MRVAVVGGGTSGLAIQHAVEQRGAECVVMSRSTGFDVRDAQASDRLTEFDVVIEAVGGTFLRGQAPGRGVAVGDPSAVGFG